MPSERSAGFDINRKLNMSDRLWVVAYNESTDECRFMQLLEEWLPFKYSDTGDQQPGLGTAGIIRTYRRCLPLISWRDNALIALSGSRTV